MEFSSVQSLCKNRIKNITAKIHPPRATLATSLKIPLFLQVIHSAWAQIETQRILSKHYCF